MFELFGNTTRTPEPSADEEYIASSISEARSVP
jgi:hypothetical protein